MDKTFIMTEDGWFDAINALRNGHILRIDVWDIIPEEFIHYDTEKPDWYIRCIDGCEILDNKEYLLFEFMGNDSDFQWFMRYANANIGDIHFDCERDEAKIENKENLTL